MKLKQNASYSGSGYNSKRKDAFRKSGSLYARKLEYYGMAHRWVFARHRHFQRG